MSATTTDIDTIRRASSIRGVGLAAAAVLLAGTMCCYNTSGDLVDGADTSGLRFAGIVEAGVDNSDGAAGDETATIYTDGEFLLTGSGFAAGDEGKLVFLIDNQTVGLASASSVDNLIPVGVITEVVSATEVWVQIEPISGKGVRKGEFRLFEVEVTGTNAAAIDLTTAAADYGGADFYVRKVIAMDAIVTSTGAPATVTRKVLTTHFTVASGDITTVGNETANTLRIRFLGHLL